MRRNESLPLDHDELEVEEGQQHEVAPDAKIVDYFGPACAVEMPENGIVEVLLVPHVDNAEVAGVVAEDASDKDDYQGYNVASLESIDG